MRSTFSLAWLCRTSFSASHKPFWRCWEAQIRFWKIQRQRVFIKPFLSQQVMLTSLNFRCCKSLAHLRPCLLTFLKKLKASLCGTFSQLKVRPLTTSQEAEWRAAVVPVHVTPGALLSTPRFLPFPGYGILNMTSAVEEKNPDLSTYSLLFRWGNLAFAILEIEITLPKKSFFSMTCDLPWGSRVYFKTTTLLWGQYGHHTPTAPWSGEVHGEMTEGAGNARREQCIQSLQFYSTTHVKYSEQCQLHNKHWFILNL